VAKDPDLSDLNPYLGKPDEPGVKYHGANPDPINARESDHFLPAGRNPRITKLPEREGPDYNSEVTEEAVDESLWIRLSYSADLIPPRTSWILKNIVPTTLRSFIRHNLQYGNTDESLGLQGQFAELFHITAKLKRQIWDRRNPEAVANGEVQEQLEALIGHALLALDLLEKGNKDGRS
jgi:hypothetical protein